MNCAASPDHGSNSRLRLPKDVFKQCLLPGHLTLQPSCFPEALVLFAGPWAIYTGDSFGNQAQNGIDYHSTHLWVDNWNVAEANSSDDNSVASSIPDPATSFAFDRQWLSTRKDIAAADGRPFVIEEFGVPADPCIDRA